MKNLKIKTIMMLMLVSILMFGSTMTVFAASTGKDATIKDYIENSDTISATVSSQFKVSNTNDNSTYGAGWNMYSRTVNDKTTYYFIKSSEESKVADRIVQLQKSSEAADNIKDITDGLNIKADTDTATGILSGFTGILSTVLGIMVVLISVGMTVFSAFDLCYIAFPVFRNKCEEAKQTGQSIMASGKINKATGENKLRFVSDDAQYAVVAAETVQTGKNPFVIYFGKRLLSYMILAILLFILLTGKISVFTSLALKIVSGILDLIASF